MKKFPTQFGRSEQYRNPDGTLPLPSPDNIPRPSWTQTRTQLRIGPFAFQPNPGPAQPPGLPAGWLGTTSWDSPWFDLRPDLRSSQGQRKFGVPIWSTACRLYLELLRLGDQALPLTQGVNQGSPGIWNARAQDWTALVDNSPGRFPLDPNAIPFPQMPPVWQPAVDRCVTPSLFPVAGNPGLAFLTASMSVFSPPGTTAGGGDGYPVRYWRLVVAISLFIEQQADPGVLTLDVEAAVY